MRRCCWRREGAFHGPCAVYITDFRGSSAFGCFVDVLSLVVFRPKGVLSSAAIKVEVFCDERRRRWYFRLVCVLQIYIYSMPHICATLRQFVENSFFGEFTCIHKVSFCICIILQMSCTISFRKSTGTIVQTHILHPLFIFKFASFVVRIEGVCVGRI